MDNQYKPYIPKSIEELWDKLASMMLASPNFIDNSGYFPGMNIDTEFFALNEGLKILRPDLGEERYEALINMSGQMRAHFEADPEDLTDEALKGRQIILDMEDILKEIKK